MGYLCYPYFILDFLLCVYNDYVLYRQKCKRRVDFVGLWQEWQMIDVKNMSSLVSLGIKHEIPCISCMKYLSISLEHYSVYAQYLDLVFFDYIFSINDSVF